MSFHEWVNLMSDLPTAYLRRFYSNSNCANIFILPLLFDAFWRNWWKHLLSLAILLTNIGADVVVATVVVVVCARDCCWLEWRWPRDWVRLSVWRDWPVPPSSWRSTPSTTRYSSHLNKTFVSQWLKTVQIEKRKNSASILFIIFIKSHFFIFTLFFHSNIAGRCQRPACTARPAGCSRNAQSPGTTPRLGWS